MKGKKIYLLILVFLSLFFLKAHAQDAYFEFEKDFFVDDVENDFLAADGYYYNYFDGPARYKSYGERYLNKEFVIQEFDNYMSENRFPKTDDFISFLQNVIKDKCSSTYLYTNCHMNYYKYSLGILRESNKIDNLFYLIINDRIRNLKPRFKDLSDYLRSLNSLYRKRMTSNDNEEHKYYDLSFLNKRVMSQAVAGYKGLSPREVLHLKYDSFQIKYLGFQLKKMLNVMNSNDAYIHVDMEDEDIDDLHLSLSYTEKYRLGVKLLKFHLKELQFDNRFGFTPMYIDVLLAGVETGVISPDVLKVMYNMPEFVDSYRNRFKTYREVLKRLGRQILINTPIVGQIAFIPIMIIEIRNEMRNGNRGNSDDTQLF